MYKHHSQENESAASSPFSSVISDAAVLRDTSHTSATPNEVQRHEEIELKFISEKESHHTELESSP